MSWSGSGSCAGTIGGSLENFWLEALLLAQALGWILNSAQLPVATGLIIFEHALISQTIVGVVFVSDVAAIAGVLRKITANGDSLGSVTLFLRENASAAEQAIIPGLALCWILFVRKADLEASLAIMMTTSAAVLKLRAWINT